MVSWPFHRRKREEPQYEPHTYIQEYWNTMSNVFFVYLGLLGLVDAHTEEGRILYGFMMLCGCCSALHHAISWKYSIAIDYAPIIGSVVYFSTLDKWHDISVGSWIALATGALTLGWDHHKQPRTDPFGHSLWHIMAALAARSVCFDVDNACRLN